jgi:hypothetical protein
MQQCRQKSYKAQKGTGWRSYAGRDSSHEFVFVDNLEKKFLAAKTNANNEPGRI